MKMKIITSAVSTTLFLASREFAVAIEGDEPERIVIGPDYKSDPAWFDCSDCDKGERIDLFMPIANTTFNCEPEDFPELLPECSVNCGQIYGTPGTRNITVYIPSGFDDSNAAALQIGIEDTGKKMIRQSYCYLAKYVLLFPSKIHQRSGIFNVTTTRC